MDASRALMTPAATAATIGELDVANANPFCTNGTCRILSCLPGTVCC